MKSSCLSINTSSFSVFFFSPFTLQLASSNPELCCEAITASWCCVLDSYRNKDFWELYSSFVKLAFQIELMQEGPESPIFESLNKVKQVMKIEESVIKLEAVKNILALGQ